jgi:hypothetical protein
VTLPLLLPVKDIPRTIHGVFATTEPVSELQKKIKHARLDWLQIL